jgi:hypothetical protein
VTWLWLAREAEGGRRVAVPPSADSECWRLRFISPCSRRAPGAAVLNSSRMNGRGEAPLIARNVSLLPTSGTPLKAARGPLQLHCRSRALLRAPDRRLLAAEGGRGARPGLSSRGSQASIFAIAVPLASRHTPSLSGSGYFQCQPARCMTLPSHAQTSSWSGGYSVALGHDHKRRRGMMDGSAKGHLFIARQTELCAAERI